MVRSDARIRVSVDSQVISASPGALDLLGLSLDELRSLPPGSMSVEQDRDASAEFAAAWEGSGRAPLVGAGTIRLPDGSLLRLRYYIWAQDDGTVEIVLERSQESVSEPSRAYTIGKVLSAWRAAQRQLEALEPGSHEWRAAEAEDRYFRAEYRRLSNQT
jgi:hypothetical protein